MSPVFSSAQITAEGSWGGEGMAQSIFHGKSRRLGTSPPCLPADLAASSLCQSFRSMQDLLILQA